LRRTVLSLATLAVLLALPGLALSGFAIPGLAQAQQNHGGPPPIFKMLIPRDHPRPALKNAPKTPEVVLDASSLGSPLKLEKGWRVGITANSAAAQPDFDDGTWSLRDAQDAFADVPDEDHPEDPLDADENHRKDPSTELPKNHQKPFVWFRMHVKLAPGHGPLALLVELPVARTTSINFSSSGPGVDVYANGNLIKPDGPHGNEVEHYQQISRIYNLNVPPNQTDLVLVVRTIYIPFGYDAYTTFFSGKSFHLGHREELDHRLELWNTHSLFERLPDIVYSILLLVLAMFLLTLYFTQKGHIEYLWLALHELCLSPLGFIKLAGGSAYLDTLWFAALLMQLVMVGAYLYFEFLVSFLSLKRRWYILVLRYSAPVLALVGPLVLMVGKDSWIGLLLLAVMVYALFWLMGWVLFTFLTLIFATARRNFEAGVLLIPLVLTMVGIFEPLMTAGMNAMGSRGYKSPLTVMAGPVPIHFASIADFTGILAIVVIIFIRFLRVQRDQERVSSELAAARSVQELMIPQEKIQTPGFEVDSVYDPANEVGGDFFHVQPTEDGGLLVIIGDVAGKGLKAAMNVSMLMGGLRRTPERSPARILESLNRVLTGSESFTTCQAAWFSADGEVVIANAGHLPPYLNSQEIAIPGGLPLGVLPDVTYEEVRLYLHPGDRILLMSDGVVEARQPSGELFGFDRVHNLTGQSAFYIADAAKAFGQEDDITILTVRRLAQAMAA